MEKEILDDPNPNNSYQDLWDQLEKGFNGALKALEDYQKDRDNKKGIDSSIQFMNH